MSNSKKITENTKSEASLLKDSTNLSVSQLKKCAKENKTQSKKVNSAYETLVSDIVTTEYIRGYN